MRSYRYCLVVLFVYCASGAFSQPVSQGPLVRSSAKGVWKHALFAGGIIKTSFQPNGYTKNEQVSNAVIAKPLLLKGASPVEEVLAGKDGSPRYLLAGKEITAAAYFDNNAFKGFRFTLKEDEKIFGTGERSLPLNRRGYRLNLYNQPNYGYSTNADNLNYSVPFLISSDGYGIFFDNPSKSYLDIGKTEKNVLEYGASSGELTFYIIPGKNTDEILRKFQSLTGTQPIPARWVFGNLMSRFGYRSEAQLMNTVNKMKQENFPVDAVILDLFWFGDSIKGTMGNLDWVNKKAWPDPAGMISKLKQQGIHTILITEPFVLRSTPNYEPSKDFQAVDSTGKPYLLTDFYFGNGGLLDIFRKDVQDWFWNKYKAQINIGVTGWWGDLGEPERHPAAVRHNLKDLGFKRLFLADEVHNIYGHYWDKMLFDRYAKEYPGTRLFNLNRSGYAGSPRYGVFPWSGDVSRSWSGLQAQLPVMIGMSMSGVPYIHADAGGFAMGDLDPELYTRWLQFATFTPVLRPHGTALGDLVPEVKDIPSEGALYADPYKRIVRRYIQMRYQLLPYNYTLAYEQAKAGKPLVRPLFYYGNSDPELYKAQDEFMWGDEILVAPVLEKGATQRKLYLPKNDWYDLRSDERIAGGQWINTKTDINDIPVFVKEGSFIPMFMPAAAVNNTGDYTGKDITVKYYPASTGSVYTLFDDDGHSSNTLLKGNYELIRFEGISKAKTIRISISAGNKKTMFTRNIKLELPSGERIRSVKINNKAVETGKENSVSFQYKGSTMHVEIQVE